MNLEKFKRLFAKFENIDYTKPGWRTDEYEDFLDAKDDNHQFYEWYLQQELIKQNFSTENFCCNVLAYHTFSGKKEESDAIIYQKSDKSFAIPIHDGGPSLISIRNCPWCGSELKKN